MLNLWVAGTYLGPALAPELVDSATGAFQPDADILNTDMVRVVGAVLDQFVAGTNMVRRNASFHCFYFCSHFLKHGRFSGSSRTFGFAAKSGSRLGRSPCRPLSTVSTATAGASICCAHLFVKL